MPKKFDVVPCSPEMKEHVAEVNFAEPAFENGDGRVHYPFDELELGESFLVRFDDAPSESALRKAASYRTKRTDKVYKVIKHNKYQLYEIGRVG